MKMLHIGFKRAIVAVLLVTGLLGQETWALAGTTGTLSGNVTAADTHAPLAGALVTASSPSQTASIKTDVSGHFTFISLSPDTYTVSVSADRYQTVTQPGVSVFADTTQQVALTAQPALKTIANVTSTAAGSLVKPGTTADVYSINAATQDRMSALGGGGGLNSAYSAIASVPGAFVPINQMGYFQTVNIRGGDFDQVGYEIDGVPVNRSFDNYPSGAASSLGQQEVQVYTGASPANAEGQGLAGYINQVIKTGTYPGFADLALGVGTPSFYHKLSFEAGGASPDRLFSYYIGLGGYNQEFRYVDQNNGTSEADLAGPLAPIKPGSPGCSANLAPIGCFSLLPYNYSYQSGIAARDVVANLHFGIPHRHDSGRDDIQLLWDSGELTNPYYTSTNDSGGPAAYGGIANVPTFLDGYQWVCNVGQTTTTLSPACVTPYFFPGAAAHAFQGPIPLDLRDTLRNSQEIVKLQYQKNFGSDAFLRVYGYSYYSFWAHDGPNGASSNYLACCAINYQLSSHTRGVSGTFSKQLNEQHLLSVQASYTTSTSVRDNNTQMANFAGSRSRGVVMVNANDPLAGYCFNSAGTVTTCNPSAPASQRAQFATWGGIASGNVPALAPSCNIPGGPSGPCTWLVAENSLWATYNTVQPKFTTASITDEFRPNDRLLLNLGLRVDNMAFVGGDMRVNDPVRQFWFKAWNLDNCVSSTGAPVDKTSLGLLPTDPCPAGYTPGNMTNSSGTSTYNVLQPRLAGTYTVNPDTVLRFSAGKYAEPPHASLEQYNTLQEDTPFELPGASAFYAFGFTNPGQHQVRPPTSLNYDLSLEKRLHGTDWSFKLTPYLRQTKDQTQQFFLDQKTAFVSAFNVGSQTSEGFEFQLNKGDFAKNGFSGQLSFTYTHSVIKYQTLANGATVVTGINNDIAQYNSLTKAGGGSACYLGGVATSCSTAGAIANPYYNAPLQALIDPNQLFATYTNFPGPLQSFAVAFDAPYTATMLLNYKHDRLSITPSIQFQGGARYGEPETTMGIDPRACGAPLAGGNPSNDPRYPYGAAGGNAYDATTCGYPNSVIPIPDPYTGMFDNLGSFVQPNQLAANLQVRYDVSPKVTLVGTFSNLLNTCWGGTKEAWTINNDSNICSYNLMNVGGTPGFGPVGNIYNPPATVGDFQRLVQYPYAAYAGATNTNTSAGNFNQTKMPFNFFVEARLKL